MKKLFLSAATLLSVVAASAQGVVKSYNFDNFKLHHYTSSEAMGDISLLVEGEKGVVVIEPQSFYKSIKDFNSYIEKLDKPLVKVVANYHAGGLAEYDLKKVVMVKPMIEFMQSPMAKGMMDKFTEIFNDEMDTRPVKVKKSIPTVGMQRWAGVEFNFSDGAASDFPASTINIGGKAIYTHFAPSKSHFAPMRINSKESIDAILAELNSIKSSGVEHIFGSHGAPATQAEVSFQIEYLERVKTLLTKCSTSDTFAQQLIVAYPSLAGAENVKAVAKSLYPNETKSSEELAVRKRIQDYFDMVSNLDTTIAKSLWADNPNISIITPRTQFFGYDSIMNDFLIKTFSSMRSRKLHSLSEVVNIYGSSANVQLYWIFDTIDAKGNSHQTSGRETLLFEKISGSWQLVHVHYSRMAQ